MTGKMDGRNRGMVPTVIDSVFGDRQMGEANFVCCFKSLSEWKDDGSRNF